MSLVFTIDDLTTYAAGMNTTIDPGVGQQVVDGINNFVETYTNRCWGETKSIIDETYDWGKVFYLRQMDVVSIDNLVVGYPGPGHIQTTLDPTGYWVNDLGRLTILWWTVDSPTPDIAYSDYIHVSYTYGVSAVPDDLVMAALGIALGFYNFAVNGAHDITSAGIGSYRLQYNTRKTSLSGASKPDPATSTADAGWAILDSYRMRHL